MKKFLLLFLLLLLPGCGQPSASEVAHSFEEKIISGDWDGACQLVEKKSLESSLLASGSECPEELEATTSIWITRDRRDIGLRKISETENRAEFGTDISSEPLRLRRTEDGWRITIFE